MESSLGVLVVVGDDVSMHRDYRLAMASVKGGVEAKIKERAILPGGITVIFNPHFRTESAQPAHDGSIHTLTEFSR
jgi:hypothetical protein